MALKLGARVFRPGLLPTIGLLLVLPMLIGLGVWQLDRAEEKRELFAQFESQAGAKIALNRMYEIDPKALRYNAVTATGRYDAAHQFLLDSMMHAGRAGYHVLTPLELPGGGRAVLVDRGWVPAGATRDALPDLPVDDNLRDVTGRIDLLPRPGLRLGDARAMESRGWPQVALFPTVEELEARLGYRLEPFLILLAPEEPDGFVREWRPRVPGFALHIGYAVQWFALALAVLVIYGVVNLEKADGAKRD
ncbi:MAG TPA: SURF1 family protein [Gammaproteobacteria bacterium]|nr:SURF1 family protein [Gammaproteobacteria bacterium]